MIAGQDAKHVPEEFKVSNGNNMSIVYASGVGRMVIRK